MSKSFRAGRLLAALAIGLLAGRALAEDDAPKRQEREVVLPAFPRESDLVEFYVSAATSNRFYIDAATLSAGDDGVVRYTLVVLTSGGATNVSHEGIRCATLEFRLYATGRSDRTWSPARTSEWRPIENKPVNRHHAALSRDYFCPNGNPVLSADEGRNALRLGKHPAAP